MPNFLKLITRQSLCLSHRLKRYVQCHYEAKCAHDFSALSVTERKTKLEDLNWKLLAEQSIFTKTAKFTSEPATRLHLKDLQRSSFTDGGSTKEHFRVTPEEMCLDKKLAFQNLSVWRMTSWRRVHDIVCTKSWWDQVQKVSEPCFEIGINAWKHLHLGADFLLLPTRTAIGLPWWTCWPWQLGWQCVGLLSNIVGGVNISDMPFSAGDIRLCLLCWDFGTS